MSDRFDAAQDILLEALVPVLEQACRDKNILIEQRDDGWDLYEVLKLINTKWNIAFTFSFPSPKRPSAQRNIAELLELRNLYSHQTEVLRFKAREMLRFLDNAEMFCRGLGKNDAAARLNQLYKEQLAVFSGVTGLKGFQELGPEIAKFWTHIRRAYRRWTHGSETESLEELIDQTPFPADLPLKKEEDTTRWIASATVLKSYPLWDFCTQVYPAMVAGHQPNSLLLIDDEAHDFHMPARREISLACDKIGQAVMDGILELNKIPHLYSESHLLKLCCYLELALRLRTMDRGSLKPGLFFLCKELLREIEPRLLFNEKKTNVG